jgi:Fe-S-cluster-containing hydrogenase component 2
MTKKIYIDPVKCTGCRTCELVCSIKNEGLVNPALSRIQNVPLKNKGQRIPTLCLQCETPFCVSVCTVGALKKDPGTDIVKHNEDLCIGCRVCFMACPFGGIGIKPGNGRIFKCELCGGDPECVKACEDEAITYDEPDVALMDKKIQSIGSLSVLLDKYAVHSEGE